MSRLEEIKSILAERKNYKDDMHFVIDTEAYEYLILSLEDGKHIDWLVRQVEQVEKLKGEVEEFRRFYELAESYLGEDDFDMLVERWNDDE